MEIKSMNKEFDTKLKNSYSEYLKGQEVNEFTKKSKIMKYKLELDRQLDDKYSRLNNPVINENERVFNLER
jgi:protein associated with RNAse G/E